MSLFKIEYNVPCPPKDGNLHRIVFKDVYDKIFHFVHSNDTKLTLDLGDRTYKQFYKAVNTGKSTSVTKYDDILKYFPINEHSVIAIKR